MSVINDDLFEEYAKKHKGMLWKFANSVKSIHLNAEDYYIMCLWTLHKCMQEFDESKNTKFSSYLYTSLKYRMMTEYDKARKDLNVVHEQDKEFKTLSTPLFELYEDEADLPDVLSLSADIKEELLKIPHGEDSYDIIVNGTSYTDIGNKHKITHTAVMRRHERVLKAIRKKFKI